MKFCLIKERKKPADRRVALVPAQARALMDEFPDFKVLIERSEERCIVDEAYTSLGITAVDECTECDVLLGIKEVPEEYLIPDKTYMFFSHTIKKQPYNQKMLRAMAANGITLIDYECLVWPEGGRILGFGRWAGIVGAYNAFLTWGRKMGTFDLKPAYKCEHHEELLSQLKEVILPPIKIALTGEGRVSGGAIDILRYMNIRQVQPNELSKPYNEPVYAVFSNRDIYQRKDGSPWDTKHFYANHNAYEGIFSKHLADIDILINGFYWENDMAALFTKENTRSADFRIKVIADITCDVEGSVPVTMKATTIADPTYGWDRVHQKVTLPYLPDTIDVMAVSTLPAELPASSSEEFGTDLLKHVLPLFKNDQQGILANATILKKGKLTEKYSYLTDYLMGS